MSCFEIYFIYSTSNISFTIGSKLTKIDNFPLAFFPFLSFASLFTLFSVQRRGRMFEEGFLHRWPIIGYLVVVVTDLRISSFLIGFQDLTVFTKLQRILSQGRSHTTKSKSPVSHFPSNNRLLVNLQTI